MKEENVTIFSTPVEARERSMYEQWSSRLSLGNRDANCSTTARGKNGALHSLQKFRFARADCKVVSEDPAFSFILCWLLCLSQLFN